MRNDIRKDELILGPCVVKIFHLLPDKWKGNNVIQYTVDALDLEIIYSNLQLKNIIIHTDEINEGSFQIKYNEEEEIKPMRKVIIPQEKEMTDINITDVDFKLPIFVKYKNKLVGTLFNDSNDRWCILTETQYNSSNMRFTSAEKCIQHFMLAGYTFHVDY